MTLTEKRPILGVFHRKSGKEVEKTPQFDQLALDKGFFGRAAAAGLTDEGRVWLDGEADGRG